MSQEIDIVQYHILSTIVGLMESYSLTPEQVTKQFEYISSIPFDQRYSKYIVPEVESSDEIIEHNLIAKSRREFSMMLSNGNRICPSYSSCGNLKCNMIHIPTEFLCPHKKKNNYCLEDDSCELIVLKACRDGKLCDSQTCSYRHD